ncbi:O-succinylhomoserine sulfhydrylase [Catalinimonas alkaloidigena]|uniref:O-succinylhomoserine sulfhydrylase n=1 Tax=Catalinimonas alkaloidigena TaxID=1075417 RepID=A0A1G9Q1D8_9BACT|nr:aminotransferase class V-fold PLP-dependent enzyme [Catalinimonas alkaloidigena]SDM04830.1 O-succinylhomoserine sulfhydrylase [Catalinimonas alkaloidigena]
MNFETRAIRTQLDRTQHREHSAPVYNTSGFIFEDAEQMRALFAEEYEGHMYSRYSNPNSSEFEEKIKLLEGVEDAFATASGMAAVFASLAPLLQNGDHIVASSALFGASVTILTKILPRYGITATLVHPEQPEAWEKAIRPNTKMLFLETPSNPGLAVIDLAWAGELARKHGLIFNVDNCFATPYLQQPAHYGADLITHSATKFIDGQGRVLGGVVAGRKDLIAEVRKFCRATGPSMAPFNAWVLSKSLETLAVRMDRHCDNALRIAEHFQDHPEVERVNYPFLPSHPQYDIARRQMKAGGGIITLTVRGGLERCRQFIDARQMISLSANLGDTRTIITHPAFSTHSKLSEEERQAIGILPGLVRLSVGLEHPNDIIADLEQALEKSKVASEVR